MKYEEMGEEEILQEIGKFGESKQYEKIIKGMLIKKDKNDDGPDLKDDFRKWLNTLPRNLLDEAILKNDKFKSRTIRKKIHKEHPLLLKLLINGVYQTQKDPHFYNVDDLKRIFTVYENILVSFEDFDVTQDFRPLTVGLYQLLNRVRWSKEGKKIRDRFMNERSNKTQLAYGGGKLGKEYNNLGYIWRIERGVDFITACHAAEAGRDEILPEDVLVAWRTYLKLLHTDLTKIGLPRTMTREEVEEQIKSFGSYNGINFMELYNMMKKDGVIKDQ